MASRFDVCLDEVLRQEGGYADHPADPGGATNMGITHKTLADWRGVSPWWDLPKSAVKALGRDEAAQIYKKLYWERSGAGTLPAGLDLALFDFAVNSGPDRAVRLLQTELGVAVDGRIGPVTRGAVEAYAGKKGLAALAGALCDRRLRFLQGLSTFPVFGAGWTSRIATIRKAALAAIAKPDTGGSIMTLLTGYKTYIVAALMLLAGLAQLLGIELPAMEGGSAGQLIMEAIAVIFLRRGLKAVG